MFQIILSFGILLRLLQLSNANNRCPESPEITIPDAYPHKNYTIIHQSPTYPSNNVPDQIVFFSEPTNLILQCSSQNPILWDFGNDVQLNQFRYIRPTRTAEDVFNTTSYCFKINLFLYRQNNATGKYTCRSLHGHENTSLFIFMQNHKPDPFINSGVTKVIDRPHIIGDWLQIPCITYNPMVPVELFVNNTKQIDLNLRSLRWNPMEGFWLNMNEQGNCTSPCYYSCRAAGNYTGKDTIHILRAERYSVIPNITLESTGPDVRCSVPPGFYLKKLFFRQCSNVMECYNSGKMPSRDRDVASTSCDSIPGEEPTCMKVQPPPLKPPTDLTTGIVKCTAGVNKFAETFTATSYRFYTHPGSLVDATYEELHTFYTNQKLFHSSGVVLVTTKNPPRIYVGQSITHLCVNSPFIMADGIQWAFLMSNGTKLGKNHVNFTTTFDIDKNRPDFEMRSTIEFIAWSTDIVGLVCMGPTWTDFGWITYTVNMTVLGGQKPEFEPSKDTKRFFYANEKNATLNCTARAEPKANITWLKDGKKLPPGITQMDMVEGKTEMSQISKSVLVFHAVTDVAAGEYVCIAENYAGSTTSQKFIVDVKGNKGPLIGLIVGAMIAILLLVALVVYLYRHLIVQRRIIRQFLSDKELDEFFYGVPDMIKNKENVSSEYSQFLPYKKEYEILPTSIQIANEEVLGSGQYGMVFKGTLAIDDNQRQVAVKTVKANAEKEYVKALLSEIKIMMTIGSHPSVVNFIGALTQDIRDGKLLIVVELCTNGSLEKYLRNHRNNFVNQIQDDVIIVPTDSEGSSNNKKNGNDDKPLNTRTLVGWALDIAAGMEYLETKKVIHADLACRNILVTADRNVKITDFGLSRQLYESSDYVKKTQVPLPWRWMAIESLKDMSFSIYSDIWAYGVTVWEIFSLGAVPYPGYNWDLDFLRKLETGLRVDKPEFSTSEIYSVMLKCMELEPEKRLSFTEAKTYFQSLKNSFHPTTADGYYCQLLL